MIRGTFSAIILMFCGFIATASAQVEVWSEEAENGILSGSAEIISGCSNASNGEFVKLNSDAGNSLLFNNITIDSEGTYDLKIYYFFNGEPPLDIVVNGSSIGVVVFPTAQWCYQGRASEFDLDIELSAGVNTLEFRTANGEKAPFLDKLKIFPASPSREGPETFYLSSSEGDDANDGLSEQSPWKSLGMISWIVLIPGDTILFKSGDTFTGQFEVNGSGNSDNPIVIGRYGEGNLPVIDGANDEGGAYETAIYIHNQDHIELRDLKIVNDRKVSRSGENDLIAYGVHVLNDGDRIMKSFHFHDLTIRDIFAVAPDQDEGKYSGVGISFSSTANTVAGKEKNISDVIVEDCYITHTATIGIISRHNGGSAGVGNDSINSNMNFIFRNNHFFETGRSGIVASRIYNLLMEYNTFEYTGSDADPRMYSRGSGAWFWKCQNVVAQYNKSLHIRGWGDSYGMHIDFGNRNVILQYNYSEDSEGGFAEILGDNVNSVYRFNVSVNDGLRDDARTLWISDFAGKGLDKIPSDSNYIYNNSIYVSGSLTPDILLTGKKTFIYNNIFYTTDNAVIGENVEVNIYDGGALIVSNNLFSGDVRSDFTIWDRAPAFGDPVFTEPGALDIQGYKVFSGSAALDAGLIFEEPRFPMAGKGIFKDIPPVPDKDLFGNPVSIGSTAPHIGAYNGEAQNATSVKDLTGIQEGRDAVIYMDPVSGTIHIEVEAFTRESLDIRMVNISGSLVYMDKAYLTQGANKLAFPVDQNIPNGIYIIHISNGAWFSEQKILIY